MAVIVIFKKFAVHQLLNTQAEDQIKSFSWQQIVNSVSAKYTLRNALIFCRDIMIFCLALILHPSSVCLSQVTLIIGTSQVSGFSQVSLSGE